jgi:hypothetical protein
MKKIKVIKVPETELDMFTKHGVKVIVMGIRTVQENLQKIRNI